MEEIRDGDSLIEVHTKNLNAKVSSYKIDVMLKLWKHTWMLKKNNDW